MNLFNLLATQASHHLNQPAIVDLSQRETRQVSFAQFLAGCEAYAEQLAGLGVSRGDKVIVMQPMSIELYWLLAALFKIEAVAVFIDPGQGLGFIEASAGRIHAKALIGSNKILYASLLTPNLRAISIKRALTSCVAFKQLTANLSESSATRVMDASSEDKPALMTFTSGSTGQPKVIERSQQFLFDQYSILKAELNLQAGQKDITTLPIFLLANLMAGVTSYLVSDKLAKPNKLNAQRVAQHINQVNADRVGSNPAFFNALQSHKLPTIKQAYVGGAPVTPMLLKHMQQLLPNASITSIYGSSEAEPISSFTLQSTTPELIDKTAQGQGLFAGRVCPPASVVIVDPNKLSEKMSYEQWQAAQQCNGTEVGMKGEILVSGPHVVQSYWQGLGDTDNKINVAGTIWHRTGDCGYFAGDNLYLLGRLSACIETNDKPLYPFSIEMAIQAKYGIEVALVQNSKGDIIIAHAEALSTGLVQDIQQAFPAIQRLHKFPQLPKDKRHQSKIDYGALYKLVG